MAERDLGSGLELEDHAVVDLQIQAPHIDRGAPADAEAIHLRQATDVFVVQIDLQRALVHGLGAARAVARHDGLGRATDGFHERDMRAGELCLEALGPCHEEQKEQERSLRKCREILFVWLLL